MKEFESNLASQLSKPQTESQMIFQEYAQSGVLSVRLSYGIGSIFNAFYGSKDF